ncbi:MAG: hypothetical protein V7K32_22220 [Nostoc sp.]
MQFIREFSDVYDGLFGVARNPEFDTQQTDEKFIFIRDRKLSQ